MTKLILCFFLLLSSLLWSQDASFKKYKDLEEALLTTDSVEYLSLKWDRLKTIPSAIDSFPNLRILDLSHNRIDSIPSQLICGLDSLQELIFTGNRLIKVPACLFTHANLKVLKLGKNNIEEIPEFNPKESHLIVIYLWSNRLQHIPQSLLEIPTLQKLNVRGMLIDQQEQESIEKSIEDTPLDVEMDPPCDCH